MENAIEELKEIANKIIDTLDNSGIYNSFIKHGSIKKCPQCLHIGDLTLNIFTTINRINFLL